MIITPGGNRSGVIGLLNVNSKYKALQKSTDDKAVDAGSTIDTSAVTDRLGKLAESFTARIGQLQESISRNQSSASGLSDISESLGQARELLVEAGTENVSQERLQEIGQEISGLVDQINATAENTLFEGVSLLDKFNSADLGVAELSLDHKGLAAVAKAIDEVTQASSGIQENIDGLAEQLQRVEVSQENVVSA